MDLASLASFFVNSTSGNIFLTGKAGTGKTTFLKKLAEWTHKKFIVVAPTGIAALNAGGVTIHSQFQLPLGTYLPDRNPSGAFHSESGIYTESTLLRRHPLGGLRRQTLREIDLLVIDEVSMLRADVLDAIDFRLRSARGQYHKSFGGVQILMIGDLFQLPPIVRDHEWTFLRRYYHSLHFFEAKALQSSGFVYIELDKIYRQSDQQFIGLLNNLRDNKMTAQDIELLNAHFVADISQVPREAITITTHNNRADEINRIALEKLEGKVYTFDCEIDREFPEAIYPVAPVLSLKMGARIMFIKNDLSGNGAYYNGKLATVCDIDSEEVTVELDDSHQKIKLQKYTWENKRFHVNTATREMDEEIIGTFRHYPVKLAWAVTVHKSQGLTFDKAVIDVGAAFAPGQVYVALSRLRSLDGLYLKTRVHPSVIASDQLVSEFSRKQHMQRNLNELLREKQSDFILEIMESAFDFSRLIRETDTSKSHSDEMEELDNDSIIALKKKIHAFLIAEKGNTEKFRRQMHELLRNQDIEAFFERLSKGADYYAKGLALYMRECLALLEAVQEIKRTKSIQQALAELDQVMNRQLEQILKSSEIIRMIWAGGDNRSWKQVNDRVHERRREIITEARQDAAKGDLVPVSFRKSKKKSSSGKDEPDTISKSVLLWKENPSFAEVALKRGLVASTIEGHIAKAVRRGELQMSDYISDDEFKEIRDCLLAFGDETVAQTVHRLKEKYSFEKVRTVRISLADATAGGLTEA